MAAYNNTFSVIQLSSQSEMEIGTIAVLFFPFKPIENNGTILVVDSYWLGVEGYNE